MGVFVLFLSFAGPYSCSGDDYKAITVTQEPAEQQVAGQFGVPRKNHFHRGSLALSPDGKLLAVARCWEGIDLWDIAAKAKYATLRSPYFDGSLYLSIRFSPDGKLVVASVNYGGANHIGIWNARTGQVVSMTFHKREIFSVTLSRDGKKLAFVDKGFITVLDLPTRKRILVVSPAGAISFSPEAKTLICATPTGAVRHWDIPSGKLLSQVDVTAAVRVVHAFSMDAKSLAVKTQDGSIRVLDTASGEHVSAIPAGETDSMIGTTFSPDGKYVAVARRSQRSLGTRSLRLYKLATGEATLTFKFERHAPERVRIQELAFSSDGRILAALDEQDTVRIWSVPTAGE